jgi:hypothetical protein
MAWIEDSDQNVLLVRQAGGLKLWTLPGGKVKRGESWADSGVRLHRRAVPYGRHARGTGGSRDIVVVMP